MSDYSYNPSLSFQMYLVDTDILSLHNDKFSLPINDFINWFKNIGTEIKISPGFSKTFFLGNSKINNLLVTKIFFDNLLEDNNSSNYVYFFLDRAYVTSVQDEIKANYSDKYKNQIDSFNHFLNDIIIGKSRVLVQYSKKDGWFDFNAAYKRFKDIGDQPKGK
jgi:hypothetical protein